MALALFRETVFPMNMGRTVDTVVATAILRGPLSRKVPPMPTVFSYLRFSNPEQEKGDSTRRQSKASGWADKNGYPLDKSLDLRDRGVSAFRGKNAKEGALALFLECIETGRVKPGDFLVIENLDRLSRQKIWASLQLIQQILGAGVKVVTLMPERVYDSESSGDLGTLIEMIVILSRAHDESDMKSKRLLSAWAGKRERIASGEKMTAACPAWLKPVRDSLGRITGFEEIPDRVAVVQRMHQLAADGMGTIAIMKIMNREVRPFPLVRKVNGRRTLVTPRQWQRSYIHTILVTRKILGEFQPRIRENGKLVPVGEPIKDYYPRVISDEIYYRVQSFRQDRKQQPGRHGERLSNLFTGLVKDARDGSNMRHISKGKKGGGATLLSSAAWDRGKGAVYISFPYKAFETAMLAWAWDLDLGDILPRKATNVEAEIRKAEGRLSDLTHKIKTLRTKAKASTKFEVLLDMLADLEQDKADAKEKLERLKAESQNSGTEALDRMKELVQRLGKKGEEAYSLRVKLRATIKRLVTDIVVLPIKVRGGKLALVDVQLTNGERRKVTIFSGRPVILPEELEDLDVRDWERWPKEFKKGKFETPIVTAEAEEMIRLEDQGLNRTEIAEALGTDKYRVSRVLNRAGRYKAKKKTNKDPRVMTWNPRGNGWVKGYKGKKYFIGMGKLVEAFPDLVEQETADGSWRAANAWWEAHLKSLQTAGKRM